MAFRARRRRVVRKRKAGKRMMVRRAPSMSGKGVYHFKRSYYTPAVIAVAAGGPDGQYGYSFTLAGLPSASEFTSLFDQYKIKGVKLRLLPRGNSSELTGAAGGNIGNVGSVIDYDDGAAPTGGMSQITQYQSFKLTRSSQEHIRYFKPRINAAAINSVAGGTQNKLNTRGWLDCDVSTTEHYGLKVVVPAPPAGSIVFDAIVTMYLCFRNVR